MALRAADLAKLHEHCRTLAGTSEDMKWGENLVFSVGTPGKIKMFALFDLQNAGRYRQGFSFKTDDIGFDELTEIKGIIPAPYAARMGWVMIKPKEISSQDMGLREIKLLLTKAHALSAATLTKKAQRELGLIE